MPVMWMASALAVAPLQFPSAPKTPSCAPVVVEIGLTGDTMVHGMQLKSALQDNGSYSMDGWFDAIAAITARPDVMLANLETNIAGEDLGYSGYPRFNSPPSVLEELREVGVDHLQTANNHCLDRGIRGGLRTLEAVEAHGFSHSGTFASAEARNLPWAMLTLPGELRVAVLGYTYGTEAPPPEETWRVAYYDQQTVELDIHRARQAGADLVIVGVHWGREYQPKPEPFQVDLAKHWIEAGADIVWGHHPHVIQPAEVHTVDGRDGLILYSMGNFISNQRDFPKYGGMIATVQISSCPADRWLSDVRFRPTWVDDRDDDRRLRFKVHPVPDSPVKCVGDGLSAEDCELMLGYRRHAAALFPETQFGELPETPASPIADVKAWPFRFEYFDK